LYLELIEKEKAAFSKNAIIYVSRAKSNVHSSIGGDKYKIAKKQLLKITNKKTRDGYLFDLAIFSQVFHVPTEQRKSIFMWTNVKFVYALIKCIKRNEVGSD